MGTAEPFRSRWSRRAKTIPMMLGATLLGVAALPVLMPLLAVADLLRLRWRLPSVRVYLFVLQSGVNDSFEILAAPVLWVVARFGTRLGGEASIRRHERIQRWSIDVLARRAERLLGVRIEIGAADLDRLGPGPVIVLCRHVNLLDASLPALVYQRLGFRVRGVIMAELLADPGFDLLYGRLGSVFITRDNDPEARRAVDGLADDLHGDTAAVIFPEGRLFRADALARALARLAHTDPGRARRLVRLRHHLPPRPGGVMSLLEGAPHADVVLLTHTGLDEFPSFASLARAVPLRRPVRVVVRRFAATAVPVDSAGRVRWLNDAWLAADETVAAAVVGADRHDG